MSTRECSTCASSINHRTPRGRELVCVRSTGPNPTPCRQARSERGACGPAATLYRPAEVPTPATT